jgi:succinoglycan biosynthesis protein ExoM
MLVTVCVITYARPQKLQRLLERLNQLTFSKNEIPSLEVIVVDNDDLGSAQLVCSSLNPDFQWVLKYSIEPLRGIPYARNHAVACASKNADFIAFIDDDEVPESSWLDELLIVQSEYDADVVTGPVLPYFEEPDVPNWVVEGKFFDLPRYPTGHLLQVAFTNNVLVRGEIFRRFLRPFDERFALTGGEDSHFFMRLYRQGCKIVWANEAKVCEWIPKNRTTMKWILLRGYRCWGTHSWCERELSPSLKVQAIRVVKGIGLIVWGLLLLIPALLGKRQLLIKTLLYIFRGAGTFSGLVGWQYQEYRLHLPYHDPTPETCRVSSRR